MIDQDAVPKLARSTALRYFAEVAEGGSFRSAAESLHIAASAINRQVSNLEEDLGVKLFERARGRAGLRLTEAGRILQFRLRSAINELRIANDEIVSLQGLQRGHVTIGVNEGLAISLVPRAVDNFHRLYPNITFSIKVNDTRRLVSQLREGDIDFAVGYNFPADADLQFVEKFSLKMFLIAASEHPLGAKSKITMENLRGTNVILPHSSLLLRQIFDNLLRASDSHINSIVETNSFELIYALVEFGIGVGIVTGRADESKARGKVTWIEIDDPFLATSILACCRLPNRSVSAAAEAFIMTICDLLRKSNAEQNVEK